jgi:hypothetical protein
VTPHQSRDNRMSASAAGVPGQVRVIFIPAEDVWIMWRGEMTVNALEAGVTYRASFFDPKTGAQYDLGAIQGDQAGQWVLPKPPIFQDWVVVLEHGD